MRHKFNLGDGVVIGEHHKERYVHVGYKSSAGDITIKSMRGTIFEKAGSESAVEVK